VTIKRFHPTTVSLVIVNLYVISWPFMLSCKVRQCVDIHVFTVYLLNKNKLNILSAEDGLLLRNSKAVVTAQSCMRGHSFVLLHGDQQQTLCPR
jgi:hypothetical protein